MLINLINLLSAPGSITVEQEFFANFFAVQEIFANFGFLNSLWLYCPYWKAGKIRVQEIFANLMNFVKIAKIWCFAVNTACLLCLGRVPRQSFQTFIPSQMRTLTIHDPEIIILIQFPVHFSRRRVGYRAKAIIKYLVWIKTVVIL